MKRVIALIRVSTKQQELESQAFKVMERILADGYKEEEIEPIKDIESGSKLSEEERSGINRLKHFVETEPIEVVYVYEVSRISRRASVVISVRDYLIAKGIQLIIINPPIKLLNEQKQLSPDANLFFQLFSVMAENETYIRKERIMRGKEKKRQDGKLAQGYPIFGYTVDADHYIIHHPKQAPIVREIFERYVKLESSGSIGRDLWMRGCLCAKTEKLISHQTKVCAILREPRYAHSDEIYRSPIISKELWDRAQEIHKSKPEYFIRKSMTKHIYPLQGFIFTEDGYVLTPSISNNRYLKMDGSSKQPISLNMKAVHGLSTIIINQYLASGILEIDRNRQRDELIIQYEQNKNKLAGIDNRITALQQENERANHRFVIGRMSEKQSDEIIDRNMAAIYALEDERQTLQYNNTVIDNKLAYLANPFFQENEIVQATNDEELKDLVNKYLRKVTVKKLGHSRYRLVYLFDDGIQKEGSFYSDCRGITYFYNEKGIEKEVKDTNHKDLKKDV